MEERPGGRLAGPSQLYGRCCASATGAPQTIGGASPAWSAGVAPPFELGLSLGLGAGPAVGADLDARVIPRQPRVHRRVLPVVPHPKTRHIRRVHAEAVARRIKQLQRPVVAAPKTQVPRLPVVGLL